MDLSRISTGGRIVAITGFLFLIDSFIPWHRACIDLFGSKSCFGENAWGTTFSALATLLAIALVAEVVAVEGAGIALPATGTVTWNQIRLGVAGLLAGFVLLQLLVGDHGLDRSFGLFIGVVLAAVIVYGTVLRTRSTQAAVL